MTVNVHVAVFAAASVAVHVTVVVPTGKDEPEAGTHAVVTPGQLSPAVGAAYVTVAAHVPGALLAVTLAGQVIVGGCVSLTVTVKVHIAPDPSEQVTVVVPTGKKLPDAGVHVTVPQGPDVVGAGYVTTAPHWFASFDIVMFAGHVMAQPAVTVTVKLQLAVFIAASVTEQLTVVEPSGKLEPDAGMHTGEPRLGQLCATVGAG